VRAQRNQLASLVNPSSACITDSVTSSASDNLGAIPTRGRRGTRCGSGAGWS
jgi:hypothetical protein